MSSSVGIAFPLGTKLPELPSPVAVRISLSLSPNLDSHRHHCCQTGSSSVLLPAQVNQNSRGTAIYSKFPSLAVKDEVHRNASQVKPLIELVVKPLIELLRDSADIGCLKKAKSIHGFVIKSDFSGKSLTVLLNHLVNAYSKCSDFGSARLVFDEMHQTNVFSWTVLIVGATENGFYHDGFNYFVEMLNHDVLPDEFALSAAVQASIGLDSVVSGEMVHAQVIIRGFSSLLFFNTSLLNMYAKSGKISESENVFNSMTNRNEVSWNAMISGFVSNSLFLEAYNSFLRMMQEGIRPNVSTFISVSKAIGQLGDAEKGREVQLIANDMDMQSNVHLGTALIDMFAKCMSLTDAKHVFESNFSHSEVNLPWNAMISGYSISRNSKEALLLFSQMSQNGVEPDMYTFCSVLNSVADMRFREFGKQVHGMILKGGRDWIGVSVCNAVMDTYAKCGAFEDMRKVFDTMEERNTVSWTALVTGYSQSSEREEAITVFSQMRGIGLQPNQFTFSSILASCASLCFLEYGQQVHGLLFKSSYINDNSVESALINMYAKCGSIGDAQKVFEFSDDPDVVSWTAMISGYAQHGMANEALKLVKRMKHVVPKPNSVTLLCVLFACSHGGLVEEGLQYFRLMKEKYGLALETEHYACVVDLLGRVGRLDEAWEFIMKMPIEPDEKVWLTMLGACRVHRNVQLAELAAQKVLSYNPENSAALVLLSNTYRETGDIENELNIRNMMNCQSMRKEPGCSWISVGGRIHNFYSRDKRHPQKDDIYKMLNELKEKLKSEPEL